MKNNIQDFLKTIASSIYFLRKIYRLSNNMIEKILKMKINEK